MKYQRGVEGKIYMLYGGFYLAMMRRAPYCYGKLSVGLSVCLSATLRYCDHRGWNTSKLISRLISLGCRRSENGRWSRPLLGKKR